MRGPVPAGPAHGRAEGRRQRLGRRPGADASRPTPAVAAVLCDRDGTLIDDVPYNGDPERVVPLPGVAVALERVRAADVRLGMVSNQSGVGRGLLTAAQVAAVNARVADLVGPFDVVLWCPHVPRDGCGCRKPAPGLVLAAAAALAVRPDRCAVVGDIGADVDAARAAGARSVLVPTPVTLPGEVDAAPCVASTFAEAVDLLLGEGRRSPAPGPGP